MTLNHLVLGSFRIKRIRLFDTSSINLKKNQKRARRYRTKNIRIRNYGAPRSVTMVTMLLRVCYLDLGSNIISNRFFFKGGSGFLLLFVYFKMTQK